jgi:single-stranded-DNA-specific exonuclease
MVPLEGENRTLARFGLRALGQTVNPGLKALMAQAGIDPQELTAGTVGYVLAPRLNAVGRLGDPMQALRLLLTEESWEAEILAKEAEKLNLDRQAEDRRTEEGALEQLAETYDPASDFGLVLASEDWHPGVVGIVASRVAERVHRPTVLVALDGDRGRGSARSIPGFDLLAAIQSSGHLLERFGGHRQAAGMEVRADRLDAFREAFNREARRILEGASLQPVLEPELEVELAEMTEELARYMKHLGPHGIGNRRPVFLARGAELAGPAKVVGTNHLKLRLRQGGRILEAIGFGLADRISPRDLGGGSLDVAFQLQENEYRGVKSLQANLKDIRIQEAAG